MKEGCFKRIVEIWLFSYIRAPILLTSKISNYYFIYYLDYEAI